MSSTLFHFQRCIGRGGYGEVYVANRRGEAGLEQLVAVKVLRPDLEKPDDALARLRDEAKMLAMLDHPVIVQIVDLTQVEGRIAMVMEYVDGIDLSRLARGEHEVPPRVVLEVMAEIAEALDTAYSAESANGRPLRLVHRDIKPENIRISKHGQVKLLDFGVARSDQIHREAQTVTGQMAFTPGYAAPEVFLTQQHGPESDIFALAASGYRALVRDRLFEKMSLTDQVALCGSRHRFDGYIRERLALLPPLPEDVRGLLVRSLAWRVRERPTASEVHDLLQQTVDAMTGPRVRTFVRDLDPLTEREVTGASLTGRTITTDTAPSMEAPPTPSSLAPTRLLAIVQEDDTASRAAQPTLPAVPPGSESGLPPRGVSPDDEPWWALPLAGGVAAMGLVALAVAGVVVVAIVIGLIVLR